MIVGTAGNDRITTLDKSLGNRSGVGQGLDLIFRVPYGADGKDASSRLVDHTRRFQGGFGNLTDDSLQFIISDQNKLLPRIVPCIGFFA